jgi:hypothetical protein
MRLRFPFEGAALAILMAGAPTFDLPAVSRPQSKRGGGDDSRPYLHPTKGWRGDRTFPRGTNRRRMVKP